VIFVKSCVG